MIKTFVNAWKVADIRKKLLFTAFVILVFRIGSVIPVPFLNIVDEINVGKGNTILTYLSLMTGSAFTYGTIFAMSITPYINASIIMQLLAVAIPALERLQKEGEEGRKKIGTITRFVTVGLGLLQSLAYFFFLRANGYLMKDASGAAFTGFDAVFQAVVIIAVLTAGTAVIMWLGEQITISGIGNGISIILFAGIVSRFPTLIKQLFQYLDTGRTVYKVLVPVVCVIFLLMIAYIVFMDNSERRLPIQYAFSYPERVKSSFERLDFAKVTDLTFEQPDTKRFRNLALAYEALHQAGNMPCIVNAANEVVVAAFLKDNISFLGMSDVIEKTMGRVAYIKEPSYEDYVATDAEARRIATEFIVNCKL